MKQLFFFILPACILVSCGSKKEENKDGQPGFPVLPFIKSQVAHIDTALYSIIQLNYIDSTRTDTVYVHREQFRALAKDFLDLPDLTDKKYRDRYKEERLYDETLNRAIIVCLPINPEKETIQRQELVVTPSPSGGDSKINNIIVDYFFNSKDSAVEKKMLWQADRSFQVTTIRQLPGKPETISTTKVIWNEPEEQ